ncbi:MAG: hypothetical protein KDA60_19245, partial [Planctomycetales bacterium]|nr:hypothetical protein [Planctomycetales bacterium]
LNACVTNNFRKSTVKCYHGEMWVMTRAAPLAMRCRRSAAGSSQTRWRGGDTTHRPSGLAPLDGKFDS